MEASASRRKKCGILIGNVKEKDRGKWTISMVTNPVNGKTSRTVKPILDLGLRGYTRTHVCRDKVLNICEYSLNSCCLCFKSNSQSLYFLDLGQIQIPHQLFPFVFRRSQVNHSKLLRNLSVLFLWLFIDDATLEKMMKYDVEPFYLKDFFKPFHGERCNCMGPEDKTKQDHLQKSLVRSFRILTNMFC